MLAFLNQYILGPALPVVLMICGGYLSVRLSFFPLTRIRTVLTSLFRKQKEPGSIPPWKAMLMALAGTLGVGNITGVAAAITAGGPGSIFWMWVSAFFAMFVKYAEIVLAVRFQHKKGGNLYGGTPYYIKEGLGMTWLACLFSVFLIAANFTVGNAVQTFAAADAMESIFRIPRWFTGVCIAAAVLFVTFGGGKRISRMTAVLIPLLSGIYFLISIWILLNHLPALPCVFSEIFVNAFRPEAGIGGVFGFLTMRSLRYGTARGILSNEAGCGTAPFAYAASETKSPAEQGFLGIVEIFADTIVLCTLTATVILLFPDLLEKADGTALALLAFERGIGAGAGVFLSVSMVLFAFASIVSWGYYGTEALRFLGAKQRILKAYLLVYSLSGIMGAVLAPGIIWEIADFSISVMTIVNTCCILLLSRVVIRETNSFFMQEPGAKPAFRAWKPIRKRAHPAKPFPNERHPVPTAPAPADFRCERQYQEYQKRQRLQ